MWPYSRPAHPRSRGENTLSVMVFISGSGSSPLTRGKRFNVAFRELADRLIPAHAGKTMCDGRTLSSFRAHPRSRGENREGPRSTVRRPGSSPLTRGKQASICVRTARRRLIPAHAGKTHGHGLPLARQTAHPRSRGENDVRRENFVSAPGSSPLTRGKPQGSAGRVRPGRLIPAHAGKTIIRDFLSQFLPAHPRSRGENAWVRCASLATCGSSPLTRGKLS